MIRVLIIGIIVLSLGIAGVSTYLIKTFKTPEAIEELEQEAVKPIFKVLVASKPIELGQVIAKDMINWQLWSEEALSDKYVVIEREDQEVGRLKDYIGSTTKSSFVSGEPILATKLFRRDEPGYLAGMLDAGMRAVSIPVNAVSSVAGFIFPGDHVDIMLTHSKGSALAKAMQKEAKAKGKEDSLSPSGLMTTTTETILKNIRVIAVGGQLTSKEKKPVVGKNMTFEVTPKQAELLALAQSMGKLSLTLRSLEEASAKPVEGTYSTDIEVSPMVQDLLERWGPTIRGVSRQDQLLAERERELAEAKGKLNQTKGQLSKAQQDAQTSQQKAAQAKQAADTAAKAKAQAEADARAARMQAAAASNQPQPITPPAPVIVKPAPRTEAATITIYRGEAQSTEDVKIK